ncbi:receptor activity-modifying protein 2 [Chionomys nivalis]|uniref:receptor activity-modifying protein 2 n=1 Tax=Chionomys nivalis TaxID=269649 RepID=UPI002598BD6B|nr:receptor activity-modifying protein 2 [Chionomys nivalis]
MLGVSTRREVKPGFWGYRGAVQPHRPSWKEEWAKARQAERGSGARRGCGSDSPCSPPPTWPPPSQPLRGSGAASCGSGRGYRLPRPGQLSSSAPPRLLAQGAMARFLEERAPGGSQLARIRAGRPAALRLPPLLLLLLLLGAVSTSPESLNQSLPTEDSLLSKENVEESYEENVLGCWSLYNSHMDSVKDWCNWTLISRHYSDLQYCLEYFADRFGLGFPNPLAERLILETHLIHFANCSLVQPTFSDPPEDVLLAMIIAPICLIPFLVTLVVWRSKDSDGQA